MGKLSRQDSIITLLAQHGKMSVEELASRLSVTPTTIRRDLLDLEVKHQIVRYRGYALLNEATDESAASIDLRTDIFLDEKKRIAKCALQFITPLSSVILDSGTTICELAKLINLQPELSNTSIATNALDSALALTHNTQVTIPSGILHQHSKTLFGVNSADFFSTIHADVAFMGTNGLQNCEALTVSSPFLLDVKMNMVRSANKIIGLADSSKFLRRGFFTICRLTELEALITVETAENKDIIADLRAKGVHIILA